MKGVLGSSGLFLTRKQSVLELSSLGQQSVAELDSLLSPLVFPNLKMNLSIPAGTVSSF